MNYTNSGALAVGAPHSLARYNEECRNAIEHYPMLLTLTEEGVEILRAFAKATGSDYDQMAEYNKENQGHIASWLNNRENAVALHCFMRGVMMRWTTIQ